MAFEKSFLPVLGVTVKEGANASGTWGGGGGSSYGCSAGMSCSPPPSTLLWVRRRLTLCQEPPEAFTQTQALWDLPLMLGCHGEGSPLLSEPWAFPTCHLAIYSIHS